MSIYLKTEKLFIKKKKIPADEQTRLALASQT